MPETQSQAVINDIPEYLRPYRNALLDTAAAQIWTKDFLANSGHFPNQRPYIPPAQALPPVAAPPLATTDPVPRPGRRGGTNIDSLAAVRGLLGDSADSLDQQIADYLYSDQRSYAPSARGYSHGGRLANSSDDLDAQIAAILNGYVNLGAGGTPLGGDYAPPRPVAPNVTPPVTAGPGGIINTPAGPPVSIGNPNPLPPVPVVANPYAGMPPVGVALPPVGVAPPPVGVALPLNKSVPPPAPPPPASGYSDPMTPMFTSQRPANFAGAAQAASMGYNPAQYADDSVAQQLARSMGASVNYTNTGGPNGPPSQAELDFGGQAQVNAGLVNDIYTKFATEGNAGMRDLRLQGLRDEIRSMGGTPGFSKGGAIRAADGLPHPAPNAVDGIPRTPFTGLQSYQPYKLGSRSLMDPNSSFTANPAIGAPGYKPGYAVGAPIGQTSQQTQSALAGYSALPTNFFNGEVYAGRGADGRATTPLGIANDLFDTSGKLALGASQNSEVMSGRNDLRSSFGDVLAGIGTNPQRFQAGDISLGRLTAPELSAPSGVSPSRLTSYQMAGPDRIDPSGGNINPNYIGGQALQYHQAGQTGDVSGSGYNPAMFQNTPMVDSNQITNSFDPAWMKNAESVNAQNLMKGFDAYQMGGVNPVQAGQISTGRFIDQGNPESYMSPYDRNVTKVQQAEAQRAFDEQKASRNAAAIKAGAFGGDRQAVSDSLAERDLSYLKNNIAATGLQKSYDQAQGQFERDRSAQMNVGQFNTANRLNADLSNQAAGLQVGARNLDATLAMNQLRGNMGLQGALANQSADLQTGGKNLDATLSMNQLRGGIGMQGLLANQQAGVTTGASNQNAANRASEFGAGNTMQAALANQQSAQANSLANLQARLGIQGMESGYAQQANLANQGAYMTAAQQNQGIGMQAALANQQARQAANQQNLNASLGVQELGANQSLNAQQLNQAAGLQAGIANQQSALATQQLGVNSGLTAAQANQQTRFSQNQALLNASQSADQLQQQAAQGNFSNRLGAMGQQTQSALAANQIGQSRADAARLAQSMELQRLQALQGAGGVTDARTQQILDLQYQDFINEQNLPYQQLNWYQGLLSGVPMGYNQEQVFFNRQNTGSQLGGIATAGLGALSNYYNRAT